MSVLSDEDPGKMREMPHPPQRWLLTTLKSPFREEWPEEALYSGLALRWEGLNCLPSLGMPALSRHRASERLRCQEGLPLPVWEPRVSEAVWVFPV